MGQPLLQCSLKFSRLNIPKSNSRQSGDSFSTQLNNKNLYERLSADLRFTSQHCWITSTFNLSGPWGYWGKLWEPLLYCVTNVLSSQRICCVIFHNTYAISVVLNFSTCGWPGALVFSLDDPNIPKLINFRKYNAQRFGFIFSLFLDKLHCQFF